MSEVMASEVGVCHSPSDSVGERTKMSWHNRHWPQATPTPTPTGRRTLHLFGTRWKPGDSPPFYPRLEFNNFKYSGGLCFSDFQWNM